jgi:hypothetical protein
MTPKKKNLAIKWDLEDSDEIPHPTSEGQTEVVNGS